MMPVKLKPVNLQPIAQAFGDRLQEGVSLARYTAARLGGPAEALIEVGSKDELAEVVRLCWRNEIAFLILGGGSNVLVSDAGVSGLVIINRARQVYFYENESPPSLWAESGANFGVLARMAAQRGLGGLEWAAGIPGTLGGAVVGNAGAHSGDVAGNLLLAEILHHIQLEGHQDVQIEQWPVGQMEYSYRSSILKQIPGKAVVLAASLHLEHKDPNLIEARMQELVSHRRQTQPPGASMGSMFKNPPGDYAGRLIEAAGLKGARVGDAQISPVHANFFINLGDATASQVYMLIQQARDEVKRQFDISLELEIDLLGEW